MARFDKKKVRSIYRSEKLKSLVTGSKEFSTGIHKETKYSVTKSSRGTKKWHVKGHKSQMRSSATGRYRHTRTDGHTRRGTGPRTKE